MSAPLVVKNTKEAREAKLEYEIHPWLKDALNKTKTWKANPARPTPLEFNGHECVATETIDKGDIVWFSYTLNYFMKEKKWSADMTLVNIVRVGSIQSPNPLSASSLVTTGKIQSSHLCKFGFLTEIVLMLTPFHSRFDA